MNEIAHNAGGHAFAMDEEGALERRLFRCMVVAVAVAVAVCAPFAHWRVTTGLLLGGVLSLVNFHWMRSSLAAALGAGNLKKLSRARIASRYVLRYFVISLTVFFAYKLNLISVAATLVGMCSFVAAVFFEAFVQLYFAIIYREES
ncbi:MAG TPA: ATP synthase subunit I [Pyrinomonadaceae bacterium]|nr:ATP synthase subunit I [Pyrinomonadaceae bacterium]